jgi:hypothetical protein
VASVEGVMHGVYVLWWVEERHVPLAAVAAILAAGDLAVSALELPTGWIADRYGYRVSLIVGSLLQVAGMLAAWLGRGVPGVLASVLLIAAGDAFRSGADQALLFRSCVAVSDANFQRREAHARALQLGALVALVVAGGAIVGTWGFDVGWLLETLCCASGLALACAMVEPPGRAEDDRTDRPAGGDTEWPPLRRPNRIGHIRAIAATILPTSVLVAAASGGLFLVQSAGADPIGMTLAVAAATLAEAAGAFAGARVAPTTGVQVALSAAGIAAAIASFAIPAAFHAAVAAACFFMGVAEPVRAAAIQRVANDRVRARAASLASACDKVCTTAALLAAGLVPRRGRR